MGFCVSDVNSVSVDVQTTDSNSNRPSGANWFEGADDLLDSTFVNENWRSAGKSVNLKAYFGEVH